MKTQIVGHSTPRPLVDALRSVLDGADDAILCSAFVKRAGVHLVEPQLAGLGDRARLVATSVFGGPSTTLAMSALADIGTRLKVANPSRGTFHPKVYVARQGGLTRALIGSANLTAGLVTNVETAAMFEGEVSEPFLQETWNTADAYWRFQGSQLWQPIAAEQDADETFEPELQRMIAREVSRDPIFLTLSRDQPNRVVDVDRGGLWVETERSASHGRPAQHVPSWMFQLAWEYLVANGSLTNRHLLATDGLNVKRSSAVMAILARLPNVEVMSSRPIELRLRAGGRSQD